MRQYRLLFHIPRKLPIRRGLSCNNPFQCKDFDSSGIEGKACRFCTRKVQQRATKCPESQEMKFELPRRLLGKTTRTTQQSCWRRRKTTAHFAGDGLVSSF